MLFLERCNAWLQVHQNIAPCRLTAEGRNDLLHCRVHGVTSCCTTSKVAGRVFCFELHARPFALAAACLDRAGQDAHLGLFDVKVIELVVPDVIRVAVGETNCPIWLIWNVIFTAVIAVIKDVGPARLMLATHLEVFGRGNWIGRWGRWMIARAAAATTAAAAAPAAAATGTWALDALRSRGLLRRQRHLTYVELRPS